MIRPDYTYYTLLYKGNCSEAEFNEQLNDAASAVYDLVGFNDTSERDEAVKNAICAAVDALVRCGGAAATGGFSIGGFHVSGDTEVNGRKAYVRNSFMHILREAGLLYQGVSAW